MAKKIKIFFLSALSFLIFSCQTLQPIDVELGLEKISSLDDITTYTDLAIQSEVFDMDTLAIFIENYFMEAGATFEQKMIRYEKLLALYDKGKIKRLPPAPTVDHSALTKQLLRLTEKFRDNPAIAPVIYTTGYCYYEEGQMELALITFEFFLQKYKTSNLRDEVAFRAGEIYFDTSQMDKAMKAYDKISMRENSPFYIRGAFKKAWVHYRSDEFDKSMDLFKVAIDDGFKKDRGASGLDLSEEGMRTVTKILSQTAPQGFKTYKEALTSRMKRFDQSHYAGDLLLSLGDTLKEQSRYEEMSVPYDIFINKYKDNDKLPNAYAGLAEAYYLEGKDAEAMDIRKKTIAKFNPDSKWYKKRFKDRDEKTDTLISETTATVANYYRDLAGKVKTEEEIKSALLEAEKQYKFHLKYFNRHMLADSTTFSLADILFKLKKYEEAASYYALAMEYNRNNDKGEKAAIAALLTYEFLLAENTDKEKGLTFTDERSKEISNKIYYVENYFREGFIGSKIEAEFFTKSSNMHFLLKDFSKAVESLTSLLRAEGPGLNVYEKLGDAHANLKQIDKAIEHYNLAMGYAKEGSETTLNTKLASLYYAKGKELADAGKYKDATDQFYKAFNASKTSPVGESSLLQLGKIYILEGKIDEVTTVSSLLREHHGKSKNYAPFLVDAAKLLKEKSRFTEASEMLEKAMTATDSKDDKQTYLFESLALLDFADRRDLLLKKLGTYMDEKVIDSGRLAQAHYMLGTTLIKEGNKDKGLKSLNDAVKEKPNPINDFFRTKARLAIASVKTEDFEKIKLTLPFEESFARKEKAMRDILTDYKLALETKIADLLPETVYLMGQVLENLSLSLLESERPTDLTPEELEEYNFQIEEKAYPVDEEAIKAYTNAVKSSTEHKLETKFTALSIDRLAKLRPASYSRPITLPIPAFLEDREVDLTPMALNEYTGAELPASSEATPNLKADLSNAPEHPSVKAIEYYNKALPLYFEDPKKALKLLTDSVEEMPEFSEGYYLRGRLHISQGRLEEGLNDFISSLDGVRKLSQVYDSLAALLIKMKDLKKAEGALKTSLSLKEDPYSLIGLGNIAHIKGEYEEAAKLYRRAETMDKSEEVKGYFNFNMGLNFYNQGEIKKAAVYISDSLLLGTIRKDVSVDIATALLLTGRVDEAMTELIRIKKSDNTNAEAYKVLGIIYELYKEDFAAAASSYDSYIKLGGTEAKDVFNWLAVAKQKGKIK